MRIGRLHSRLPKNVVQTSALEVSSVWLAKALKSPVLIQYWLCLEPEIGLLWAFSFQTTWFCGSPRHRTLTDRHCVRCIWWLYTVVIFMYYKAWGEAGKSSCSFVCCTPGCFKKHCIQALVLPWRSCTSLNHFGSQILFHKAGTPTERSRKLSGNFESSASLKKSAFSSFPLTQPILARTLAEAQCPKGLCSWGS